MICNGLIPRPATLAAVCVKLKMLLAENTPPPEFVSPAALSVYVKVVGVGTAVMVNVPLKPATGTWEIVTTWPASKPCGVVEVIVTVEPPADAEIGAFTTVAVTVPPIELASPDVPSE